MHHKILELPKNKKFLLGFSGGVDSSALFFLLKQYGIEFDLAIVDYGVREQSKLEVAYAKELGLLYHKQVHLLNSPIIKGNFESQARKIRYAFFQDLIRSYSYYGILLAHQLNDRLEWLLMQFQKGVGLNTLLGFGFKERRDDYFLYRPLLEVSKAELYAFCKEYQIRYFEDCSNENEHYLRNKMRKLSSFLLECPQGIRSSFIYLQECKDALYPPIEVQRLGDLCCFEKRSERENLHHLDLECKTMGYVLSYRQKQEILRCGFSCEVGAIIIDCNETKIFIAPKVKSTLTKEFKDFARMAKIPIRIRKNLFLFYSQGGKKDQILTLL